MTDPEFIPPPAGEPIPASEGATDASLGGVLVDEVDDTEAELIAELIAGAGLPTWPQVYNLARSYLGTYPPGRLRENVNDFTRKYYGTSAIAAAWCFIFIWYVLDKLGGANLIGGKQAYVPWLYKLKGYRSGHSGVAVGAIAAINGFGHIGFVTRVGGGTFNLLSGNSTSGNSSDAITVKTYPLSIINGYVNLAYATTPTPTPTPPPAAVDDDCWVS